MKITSTNNDNVKNVRALQSRSRARRKSEHFVIEGINLIEEALKAKATFAEIYYTDSVGQDDIGMDLLQRLSHTGAPLIPVTEDVMQAMSDTQTPQGLLAVMPWAYRAEPDDPTFVLVIDGINDPGNMGTIMRTAVGAGVDVMVTTVGTVDLTNPKVVRSAMGAHFWLPVRSLSWEGITRNYDSHAIFLAEPGDTSAYHRIDWTMPSVLIVSDEAHGASDDARRIAHAYAGIPMANDFDSLNVAVATGIMLFEIVRQRSEA